MTSGVAESGKAADGQSTNCAKLNRKTAFRCDSEAFPVCATKRGVHPSSKAAAQAVLRNAMRPHRTRRARSAAARWACRTRRGDRAGDSARPPTAPASEPAARRSEEHTSELQSLAYLVCRLLLEKKKQDNN